MNGRNGDNENRNAPSDAAVQGQRAFFGRRKGHKLRMHQADLIAIFCRNLLI
jgi:tRNA (guanine-N7-)-methyltransferase